MTVRRVLLAVLLVVSVAGGAGGWYVASVADGFQQPTVTSIDSEFGAVTTDDATIHSKIVLENPNNQSFPAAATIDYQVAMNGVVVATGTKRGVGLQPGHNELTLDATFNNSKIPEWWVASINANDTVTVTTTGRVRLPGVPFSVTLPPQEQQIDLQLLDVLANSSDHEVRVANTSLLSVRDQRASWGTADTERTPLTVAVDVENVHDAPITLDGTRFRIRLNDVVVGNGTTPDELHLAPGETATFRVNAALDTQRMQDWWVSHLRANQSTTFAVEVYGLVEEDGTRHEVPVAIYQSSGRFSTDVLGNGSMDLERTPPTRGEPFTPPTLGGTNSAWGPVGDETTTITTQATVVNPTPEEFSQLLDLQIEQSTQINGVAVASGTTAVEGLAAGNSTINHRSQMAHDSVPSWWARHLNNGEQSTMTTTTNATVDLGVTTLPLTVADRTSTIETDLLRSMHNDTARSVTTDSGRELLTIERTTASWGTATAERAPLTMRVTLRNDQPTPATLRDVTATTRLNDITLTNRTGEASYTIAPYSTRTIEITRDLDNTKMAAWWPTHVRNGERSTLQTTVEVTVESSGQVDRVTLDGIGGNSTIETDVLAGQ